MTNWNKRHKFLIYCVTSYILVYIGMSIDFFDNIRNVSTGTIGLLFIGSL